MADEKPTSRERGALYLEAAMKALKDAGGELPLKEIQAEVAKRVHLRPIDLETYEKSGYTRWTSVLHFYSIDYVKAGFLRKTRGRWILTPEGEKVLSKPSSQVMDLAKEAYKQWKASQDAKEPAGDDATDEEVDHTAQASLIFDDALSRAQTEIRDHVRAMSPYEFQDFVAALLRAMGYSTPVVSSPGKDGGTDILAYPDPLGTETPHIRVQVKHRPNDSTPRKDIAELRGILRTDREVGLFVSSGGFSKDAKKEAEQGAVHIRLMDLDDILDLWQTHYDNISEEDRSLLRLRRVFFLSPD